MGIAFKITLGGLCCADAKGVGKGGEGGVLDGLRCGAWIAGVLQRWCEGGKPGEGGEGGVAIARGICPDPICCMALPASPPLPAFFLLAGGGVTKTKARRLCRRK